jgi:hypothetical protein
MADTPYKNITKGAGKLVLRGLLKKDGRLNRANPFLTGDPPPTKEDGLMLPLLNDANSQALVIAPELEPQKRVFASSD